MNKAEKKIRDEKNQQRFDAFMRGDGVIWDLPAAFASSPLMRMSLQELRRERSLCHPDKGGSDTKRYMEITKEIDRRRVRTFA